MGLPGPLTADQEKQLRTVQSSGRHLLALINDLLDLAKIGAGRMEFSIEPVDCAAVLEEAESTLRPQAEARGLQFIVDKPAGANVGIRTDRRAFSQIVLNLAGNAVKFTESGFVRIGLRALRREDRPWIEIRVEDSGIGIRPEDRHRLFDAFTQMDSASRRRGEGTGLGLHLSRKLAELLGGDIRFESEFGHGSVFILSLPDQP
jgi:protein-histidine pros-kinase